MVARIKRDKHVKHLEQCLTYSKYIIYIYYYNHYYYYEEVKTMHHRYKRLSCFVFYYI